jgi:hypothetical protein
LKTEYLQVQGKKWMSASVLRRNLRKTEFVIISGAEIHHLSIRRKDWEGRRRRRQRKGLRWRMAARSPSRLATEELRLNWRLLGHVA